MTPATPTLEEVLLDLIDPGFQFRSGKRRSPEFYESVRVEGVRVPPLLTRTTKGRFRIIGGQGRIEAAREAGFKAILAVVHPEMPEAEEKALGLLDNLAREDITPFDTFTGIVALDELGMKGKDIGPKCGLSAGMVSQYLALRKLPPEAMDAFKVGTIGITPAYKIATSPEPLATLALFLNGETREAVQLKTRQAKAKPVAPADFAKRIILPPVGKAAVVIAARKVKEGKGEEISLDDALEAVQEAARQIKAAQAKGISAATAARYFSDIASAS